MTILYKNKTAKEQFCSEYKKKWRYPDQVKKKLEAAENFIINSDVKLQDVFENIDNIYNLKYPKSNEIIKREIEKANFNSNKEGCVIGKNRCTQCNDSDIENLKICASCNDSYFLPNSKYPLGCNQCTNHCTNCTDDLSCIDCENDLVPNNMTGKCEFIQLTDLVSNTIFNLEE